MRNITGQVDCQGYVRSGNDSLGAFAVKSRGGVDGNESRYNDYSRVRTFDANQDTSSYGNPMANHANGVDIHPHNVALTPIISF